MSAETSEKKHLVPITGPTAALAWTPELLRYEVENEKALRAVMIEYFKGELKESHHFYNLPGQEKRKPALAKEGALNICSLFKVVPEPDEPHETFTPDEHYTVRFRYRLRSLRTNGIVAVGDGSCTTREDKYAYRWMWPREVPKHLDKETLPARPMKTRNGTVMKYRVPNEDLPSTYNTVLKMASKRALVDAVLKLPLVSELFTQDLEEDIAESQRQRASEDEPPPDESSGPVTDPRTDLSAAAVERKKALRKMTNAFLASGITPDALRKKSKAMFGKERSEDLSDDELETLTQELEGLALSKAGTKT